MSSKKIISLNIFLSLLPIWLFFLKAKLDFLLISILLYLCIFFIFFKIINDLRKKNIFFLSCAVSFGLDQNLLSNLTIVKPNFFFIKQFFSNVYIADLLILIFFFLISFFFITKTKINGLKIINVFLIFLIFFNIYNSYTNKKYVKNFSKSINTEGFKNIKNLVIILDEFSGYNSTEKNYKFGKIFNEKLIEFSKKYNFIIYTNANSLSANTATSISGLMNFAITQDDVLIARKKKLKKSKNFYNEYDILENKFFKNFNKIAVIQNIHLNYCNNIKVISCYQLDIRDFEKEYTSGFKNNFFSHFMSLWKYNGSSLSKIFWRVSKELSFSDSTLEPESHKIYFPHLLKKISEYLLLDHDLVFAHFLNPHIPYGYDNHCNYNGNLSIGNSKMKKQDKFIQHNIERICILKNLDFLMQDLIEKKLIENLNITILSDHGSRITNTENFSSIYMEKKINESFKEIKSKQTIQNLFKKNNNLKKM